MEKFKNKYRVSSARAPFWDYGWDAAYFITICTHDREYFFGEIVDGEMNLNALGKTAQKYWREIPHHFSYIILREFVVMPNPIHRTNPNHPPNPVHHATTPNPPNTHPYPKTETTPKSPGGVTGHHNPMLHENIPRIIRWCKGRCTFEIRKIQVDFGWQSRYHDHIIRNKSSFKIITNYIINNPKNWNDDTLK